MNSWEWKSYVGEEIGEGTSSVAKVSGIEYEISNDRFGQIFLTVRMPNGHEFTSQKLRNVETARVAACRHYESCMDFASRLESSTPAPSPKPTLEEGMATLDGCVSNILAEAGLELTAEQKRNMREVIR